MALKLGFADEKRSLLHILKGGSKSQEAVIGYIRSKLLLIIVVLLSDLNEIIF
jgi:hypothetical protein